MSAHAWFAMGLIALLCVAVFLAYMVDVCRRDSIRERKRIEHLWWPFKPPFSEYNKD